MDKLVVRGGNPLTGSLTVSGSKNTALPLMAAALLTDEPVVISNVPRLRDVHTFSRVIRITGTDVEFDEAAGRLSIDAGGLVRPEAPYELVKRMRASFYMLGGLLGRCGQARVSLPGGCAWGPRPVDLHIQGMKALGADIELDQGYVEAYAPGGRLAGGIMKLEPSSVGATVNFLLGAVTASGGSRLENAAKEPDVVVFCDMLCRMGARIEGAGTDTLEIEGVDALSGIDFANCPDRIELGTFMIAAAIAGQADVPFRIDGAQADHLGFEFINKFRATGCAVDVEDSTVTVTPPDELRSVSVTTDIYPGFPTDLQAQWTVLLACTSGNGKVRETIYTDRFKHIPELRRMGVNAIVVGSEVVVEGANPVQGAQVMSTDLRASVSLVLAALVADGETHVQRIYHLDRGYENLELKLKKAGIDIERVRYDEWADPE